MLSEHDLGSVSCGCVRVCGGGCSLLLTCHWLLGDVGPDNGGEGGYEMRRYRYSIFSHGGPKNKDTGWGTKDTWRLPRFFTDSGEKCWTFIKTEMNRFDLAFDLDCIYSSRSSRSAFSAVFIVYNHVGQASVRIQRQNPATPSLRWIRPLSTFSAST